VLEGVEDVVEAPLEGWASVEGTQEPLLLVVADVGKVPHQRGHERRVLGPELVVVEVVDEGERVLAALVQGSRHHAGQRFRV
jgi:hypothetical protein